MKKILKIQSVSDIITNSSSEAFMLDSTKLSKEDLEYFNNAITEKHAGVAYILEYLKQCPYDIIEFSDLLNLSWDDFNEYEKIMKTNDESWDINNINKFLALHNKSLEDLSKYIVVYEEDRYADNYSEELNKCYNIGGRWETPGYNEGAVVDHSFCF